MSYLFTTCAAALLCVLGAEGTPQNAGVAPLIRMNNGRYIPQFALGTFLGWDENGPLSAKQNNLAKAIEWAIEHGYRHFDTASIYNTEEHVGLGVNAMIEGGTVSRSDLFVTTKLWNDNHGSKQVVEALRESLKKLNLEYVDLYLVHWPMAYSSNQEPEDIGLITTWRGMEEAYRLGLARSIGLSNFNERQIEEIMNEAEIKPAVLEIEVNPNLTNEALVQFAKNRGLVVMAYSPFGSMVPARTNADSPAPRIDDPVLVAMAEKYKKTTPQIILRYLIDRGLVPIPKSINKDRIKQNIEIFDFELTSEEVDQISSFNRDRRIVLPSFWQDHPEYPFEKIEKPLNNPF